MSTTQRTLRPATDRNQNSSDSKDADNTVPQLLPRLAEDRLPSSTADGQDKKEAMLSDYHSEEVELEDLKAFERRMEELAASNRPRPIRWPLVLGTIFACTAISACHWMEDVRESGSMVLRALSSRGALALSLATIVMMILYGVKRVSRRYPSESVEHTREALAVFQLHCDNDGRLTRLAPMPRETNRTAPGHSRASHFTH